jgi:hypothetical protein
VCYADLVADPGTTVAAIRGALGMPEDGALDARVREYIATKPKGKHGEHRYSLADFGLDAGELAQRFTPYRERFAVPPEPETAR